MAQTMLQGGSFDCGNSQSWLASGTGSTADCVSSPAPWTSNETYCYQLANVTISVDTPQITFTAGDWVTIGGHVRFDNITSDTLFRFLVVQVNGGAALTFRMSSGSLRIDDAAGTLITYANAIAIDTWYRFSIRMNFSNAADLRVWWTEADNVENMAPVLDTSSADTQPTGATVDSAYLEFYNDSNQTYSINTFWGSWYVNTDASTNGIDDESPLRQFWTTVYRSDKASTVRDFKSNNLSSGTWANAEERGVSTTNYARYSTGKTAGSNMSGGITFDGTNGGPLDDSNVGSGTLWWNGWVFYYQTSGVTGGKGAYPSWQGYYGSHATATSDGTTSTVTRQSTSNAMLRHFQVSGGSQFSGKTKNLQMGIGLVAGDLAGTVQTNDHYGYILYEEPAQSAIEAAVNGLVVTSTDYATV